MRFTAGYRGSAGQALTEPRPAPTDPDLHLDGRLETIDVGTIQELDLDESHGCEDSVPVVRPSMALAAALVSTVPWRLRMPRYL